MAYPQAAGTSLSAPPTPQESVTGVLAQALSQFGDVEQRIIALRDRAESRKDLGKPAQIEPAQSGMMTQASLLRNTSARLQNLCSELESIL